jgi:type IV secretion system protein VirB6
MTEFHFYTTYIGQINDALTSYVGDTTASTIEAIKPVARTGITLFVVCWGWSMFQGLIQELWSDGFKRILKIITVYALATNIGLYNDFLADWLWKSPEALADVMAGGHSSGVGTSQFLDEFLSQFFDMFDKFKTAALKNSTAFIPDLTMLGIGFLILICGMALTGFTAILLIAAKMALAVLLAAGPIFVFLVMFEPTKKFFDSWMGQILTCVFTVFLLSATLKLIIFSIKNYLTAASALVIDPGIDQAIPLLVMSGMAIVVLKQIPSIASALGGGVAISSLGAFGAAGGALGKVGSALRPTNAQKSMRQVAKDVQIVRAAFTRNKSNNVKKG